MKVVIDVTEVSAERVCEKHCCREPRKSKNAAEEELVQLINAGYQVLGFIDADFTEKKKNITFSQDTDLEIYGAKVNEWGANVIATLIMKPTGTAEETSMASRIVFSECVISQTTTRFCLRK